MNISHLKPFEKGKSMKELGIDKQRIFVVVGDPCCCPIGTKVRFVARSLVVAAIAIGMWWSAVQGLETVKELVNQCDTPVKIINVGHYYTVVCKGTK